MRELGQETWSRATVSELERGGRRISVDELPAIAIALGLDVPTLLRPSGVDRRDRSPVVIGGQWDAKPAELYGLLTGRGQAISGRWDGNRLLMLSVTVIRDEDEEEQ